MSFSLVHFYVQFSVYNKQGTNVLTLINSGKSPQEAEIDVDYQFQNQSTPSTTQITLHNLNNHDYRQVKTGDTVAIWAGWYDSNWINNNVSHIFTSTISQLSPMTDSAGDWQMSITCQDGNKFSGEVALSKLYRAKSKSVRRGASGSGNTQDERIAIRQAENIFKLNNILLGHKGKAVERWFRSNSNYLTSNSHSVTQKDKRIEAEEKAARAAARAQYPSIRSNGKRGRGGNGSSKINSSRAHERREASKRITQEFTALRNALKAQRAVIKTKRHHISNVRRQKMNVIRSKKKHNSRLRKQRLSRIRTKYGAKRERARRAQSKQKSKAKKTSASGLHFKKNTTARTIILKLAKIGHIKISKLSLVKPHRFTSGYTATKTPWQEIQTVAQDYCNSNIWWPHGELYIGNFAQHRPMDFTLTPDTGLTQTPTADNDDDSDDDNDISTQTMSKKDIKKQERENAIANPTTYQVNSVFLPFLTTGSTFRITDPSTELSSNADGDDPIHIGELFNDEVVVQSGELSFGSGDMPSSQFDVIPESALVKKQKQSDKNKALKAKEQARKDKHKRQHVKAKRRTRRAKRVRVKHARRRA